MIWFDFIVWPEIIWEKKKWRKNTFLILILNQEENPFHAEISIYYTRVYLYQILLESILYIHHLVDPFPKCLAGFMSPKFKSLGMNKGHASTRKYCTETDHETEISMSKVQLWIGHDD